MKTFLHGALEIEASPLQSYPVPMSPEIKNKYKCAKLRLQ
jgi:hypothetical protein